MPKARTAFSFLFLAFILFRGGIAFADAVLTDQWMEITMNGRKIGFSHQRSVKTKSGYTVNDRSLVKLEVEGTAQEISTSATYFLDGSFRPLRFSYMQKMMNHEQFFEGVVKGGTMDITVSSAGNVTRKTIELEDGTYIADAMSVVLGQRKLEEGKKSTYKVFLEPLLATETMTVEVGKKMELDIGGKKEPVIPVIMRLKSFTTITYVAPDGRVVREISAMGLVSQAVDEARAVEFPTGVMPFTSLLAYSLIPLERPLENPGEATAMDVRISGLSSPGLLPRDDRQKVTHEERAKGKDGFVADLSVKRNGPAAVAAMARPVPAAGFKNELAPSVEAQSDDPDIIRQAGKIVGDEKDVFRAAVKINRWVFQNVRKKYIDTFSAVDTLKSMEGECQSHANLFTALARASGIPTRTVSGIVYSQGFNGFLYHAWPEVFAGSWIAMDPTFGQDFADATHIKLAVGELSSQLQLFEFIGRIGMEMLDYRSGK